MNETSHGYDVSSGYNYGFMREMAPNWLDLCARIAGYRPPSGERSFRYLELGSGQGAGLCLLAASNPHIEFLGIDFLAKHIAHAKSLAKAGRLTNIRFRHADFLDLADGWPEDFGEFDYVAFHGVYSWVSPHVRQAIVKCLHRATREGSLVYNAYNAQPGWLSTMPFQHITRLLKETSGRQGRAPFDDSVALFERLHAAGARTFGSLPGLKGRLESVKTRKTEYLTHEYLHENWHPLWHSEVAREFRQADLHYVGSGTLVETLLPGLLPLPLRDEITGQSDEGLRQDVQDFAINQSFRRDIFCRGSFPRSGSRTDELMETRLHLVFPPDRDANLEVRLTFGNISMQPASFAEIVEALGAGPMSIREIAALPAMASQGIDNILQILIFLIHERTLAVASQSPGPRNTEIAQGLNAEIARAGSNDLPYDHIAASELGSAIPVTTLQLMLLNTWLESNRTMDVATLANGISRRLAKSGRQLEKEQSVLGGSDTRQALSKLARNFLDLTLPRWRRIGAIL